MGPSLQLNLFSTCRSAPGGGGLPFASELRFSLRKGASAPQLSLPHKANDSLSPLEGLPRADLVILLDSLSPLEGLPQADLEISMDSLSPLEGLPQADLEISMDSFSPLEGLPRVNVEIAIDSLSPFKGLPGKLLLTAL